ncbi:MAG: lamin tail domain-containing protein [Tannerellaceae bacterium]|nr:lamin tail domain-containing protein [Tannerellaceae bacterium]
MSIYLTEVPYHTNMMLELEVTLDFKPTNSNNCRIQVFSYTNLTLTEKFYIQIGNNNTQISLYWQDTGNPVLCIGGRRSLIESPYTKVYIRLLLLESKTWVLQTRTENEPVYTTEGTYNRTVPDYIKKGTFMITCRYIKSRISTFWFDNISIQSYEEGSPGDKDDIPELENIIIRSLSQIELAYTAPVNISTAVVTITGMGKAEKLAYRENNACVLCDFPFQLEKEETYELEIKGLKTIAGTNVPTEKWEIAVEEGNTPPPEPPPAEKYTAGMVLINEIMADPKGLTELPETEYIELYNASGESISLNEWIFTYGTQNVKLPEVILPAGGYLVLFREGRAITVDATGIELPLSNFPSALSNTGKDLSLTAPDGTRIDEVAYGKATSGRSWEREGENWHLSLDSRGGTPGSKNSSPETPALPDPGTEEVNPGDIIFNELLPNPYPEGSEFIELYNRSGSPLPVNGLSIAVRKTDGTLSTNYSLENSPYTLPDKGYLVITKDKAGVLPFYTVPDEEVIWETKMPVLNNSSSTLVLFRTSDQIVIDEIAYSSRWHASSLISEKGVSLERVNPETETQNENNWASASQMAGFATPGYQNSQFMASTEEEGSLKIGIGKPVYHENGTYTIDYQLDKAGYYCQAIIYSLSGNKLTGIAGHTLTGTAGTLTWDGTSGGTRLPAGLYLLYIEFYHPEGGNRRFKIPLPVR